MENIIQLGLIFFLLFLAGIIFVRLSQKLRRGGGSLTTTMLGATDAFYHKERKNAVRQIVEMKAGKKQEEQGSKKPIKENDETI